MGDATVNASAAAYAAARRRIVELARPLGEGGHAGAAAVAVPACPAWSVRDLVAHLAGVCADILSGNLAGVATDAWTAPRSRPAGAGDSAGCSTTGTRPGPRSRR